VVAVAALTSSVEGKLLLLLQLRRRCQHAREPDLDGQQRQTHPSILGDSTHRQFAAAWLRS
jgi:hypothetical protein